MLVIDHGRTVLVDVAVALLQALESGDPAPALREVLNDNPESRDRWYLYRADRLHDHMKKWLEDHEVATTEPPPWE